jgi:hypothetical protein
LDLLPKTFRELPYDPVDLFRLIRIRIVPGISDPKDLEAFFFCPSAVIAFG